jgi:hypothetical protein
MGLTSPFTSQQEYPVAAPSLFTGSPGYHDRSTHVAARLFAAAPRPPSFGPLPSNPPFHHLSPPWQAQHPQMQSFQAQRERMGAEAPHYYSLAPRETALRFQTQPLQPPLDWRGFQNRHEEMRLFPRRPMAEQEAALYHSHGYSRQTPPALPVRRIWQQDSIAQPESAAATSISSPATVSTPGTAPPRGRTATELLSEHAKRRKESSDTVGRSLDGESRLVIDFESFGKRGAIPQIFGRERWILPDGLRGTHNAYNEVWRFEIVHAVIIEAKGLVQVTWRITHLTSKVITERTETEEEADKRATLGWTIATKVFLEAMEKRVLALRSLLEVEENPQRRAGLEESIRNLQPKGFTQGPLMFGLRHRAVQQAFPESRLNLHS